MDAACSPTLILSFFQLRKNGSCETCPENSDCLSDEFGREYCRCSENYVGDGFSECFPEISCTADQRKSCGNLKVIYA